MSSKKANKKRKPKLSEIFAEPLREQLLKLQEDGEMTFKDPVILRPIHKAKMERRQAAATIVENPAEKSRNQPLLPERQSPVLFKTNGTSSKYGIFT